MLGLRFTVSYSSINRMSVENVKNLLEIIKKCGGESVGQVDPDKVSEEYNQALVFQPGRFPIRSIEFWA